jgi:hypothetical protein
MNFFRKRTKLRSFAAICAAYAVILHAFFGGIVLSQNAAAAGLTFVICQSAGSADTSHDGGQTPSRHLDCAVHCATHAAGTVPQALSEILAHFPQNAAPLIEAAAEAPRSHERTPRLAQAPPANA